MISTPKLESGLSAGPAAGEASSTLSSDPPMSRSHYRAWLLIASFASLNHSPAVAQASFDIKTNQLKVPTIDVNGSTYRNLSARLDPDGRLTILSLTAPIQPTADFQSCQAPTSLSPSAFAPRAVYQTGSQMRENLAGSWYGCDIYGSTVSITFKDGTAVATISRQKNYYGSYSFCTLSLSHAYSFVDHGEWSMTPSKIACAEGDGSNHAQGNVFEVYMKGGAGVATELMLEMDFMPYAVVLKK